MTVNLIDKRLEAKGKSKNQKTIRLASEPDEFEVIELPSLIKAYEEWKKTNKGGWTEFIKSKPQKLSEGGSVEKYEDLIDAFEKGIDVMPDEKLSEYIKRIRYSEMLKAVRSK
jgi:hypothetical protein